MLDAMDPYAPHDGLGLLGRVRRTLGASAAEVAGLVVLSAGAALATGVVWWSSLPGAAAPEPPTEPAAAAASPGAERLTVHVTGAVVKPGVIELPPGSRVADAVAAAGGALPDAGLEGVNLARELTDGEQVAVPSTSGGDGPDPHAPASPSAWRADGRLGLNAATGSDLEELPGIGPVLAQRILDWREANGPFTAPEQLLDVPGIGDRTFERLADLVTP